MAKKKVDLSLTNLLTFVAYAVIGVLLLVLKGGSLGILMTVAGVFLIVLGVMDFLKGNLLKGIIQAGMGVAIIALGWIIADWVLFIFGLCLIVKGALDLLKVFKNGLVAILPALGTIVVGVLLVIAKWALLDTICIIAGVVFIINAVLVLLGKK